MAGGISPDFTVFQAGATLGRGPTNTLVMPNEVVSARHCEFVWKEDRCYMRDMGSTLGTFYRISKKKLELGEIYELGSVEIVIKKINIAPKSSLGVIEPTSGPISLDNLLEDDTEPAIYNFIDIDLFKDDQLFRSCTIVEHGVVGRKGTNSICVPLDDHMSGKHCSIYYDKNHFWIEDAPSMNG